MVVAQDGRTAIGQMLPVLRSRRRVASRALSGEFGFAWALAFKIAGIALTALGLGLDIREALAADPEVAAAKPEDAELNAAAAMIAAQDPQKRPASFWKTSLASVFGMPATPYQQVPGVPTAPTAAGIGGMPVWGWVLIGVGGFIVLSQMGILKLRR